jgi:hypothetical protein
MLPPMSTTSSDSANADSYARRETAERIHYSDSPLCHGRHLSSDTPTLPSPLPPIHTSPSRRSLKSQISQGFQSSALPFASPPVDATRPKHQIHPKSSSTSHRLSSHRKFHNPSPLSNPRALKRRPHPPTTPNQKSSTLSPQPISNPTKPTKKFHSGKLPPPDLQIIVRLLLSKSLLRVTPSVTLCLPFLAIAPKIDLHNILNK